MFFWHRGRAALVRDRSDIASGEMARAVSK